MLSPALMLIASSAFGAVAGSIPFGFLMARLRGIDIRARGSGNIGFTNVQRTMGLGWGLPVLLLDAAKGALPVALSARLGLTPEIVGIGAVLGHVFTPWLGFRGGKGVATTIGVASVLCPRSVLAALTLYAIVLLASGFVSLSSLTMAAVLAPLTWLLYPSRTSLLLLTVGVGLVIVTRHRSNIARLLTRTEPRMSLWLRLFRKT